VGAGITNAIKTLALAVVALALAFDWVDWSDEQAGTVLAVVAAVFVMISAVAAFVTRQRVTPVAVHRNRSD